MYKKSQKCELLFSFYVSRKGLETLYSPHTAFVILVVVEMFNTVPFFLKKIKEKRNSSVLNISSLKPPFLSPSLRKNRTTL